MYLNSNNYSDKTELLNAIEKEKKYLSSEIEIETQKGKTILENSNIILMNILSTHMVEGNELLAKVNEMLDKTKTNISLLTELKSKLGDIKVKDIISENIQLTDEYNKLCEENLEQIVENTAELENFNTEVSTYIKRIVYDKADIIKMDEIVPKSQKVEEISEVLEKELEEITENAIEQKSKEVIVEDLNTIENEKCDIEITSQDNNRLIISEKDEKVYLPYKMEELERKLIQSNKYKNVDEIIQAEYILDLNIFKNSMKARFKQGFNLIKNKEKGSFINAVKVGTELMFNYSLNPAIIAACKSEEELKKYLECLEEKKMGMFKVFDVEFDVAPSAKHI